ncbi:MAG TPA: hypothetical protein VFT72_13845 [Opitutaceae bacterium]|nr:hypothetical protein [Opitutaceae bacterium]
MKRFVSGRPYWWQWFTILSLDATAVAIAWQAVFARAGSVTLHWPHVFILGSSVWLAYTADRWIEGWRLAPEAVLTQRHYFAVRWRWPQMIAWCLVLAADLTISIQRLTTAEFKAGLLLLVPVLAYLLSHQLLHRNHPWRLPKEICVALLMCGGAVVFVLPQLPHPSAALWMLTLHFGILCFANCVLISIWENEVDESHGQDSLAKRLGRFTHISRAIPLMLTVECSFVALDVSHDWLRRAYFCIAASGLLLAGVDYLEMKAGRQLARVLADAVLLTPVVALLIH